MSGALTVQSGPPYSVLAGQDNSLTGIGADFADVSGGISRAARQDPGRDPVREWFNTRAFTQNATGTFGNAGRNIVIGPGLANLDFALSKNFIVYHESRIQFRTEFFNLFNHTNLNPPRSDRLTSGTYGRITSAFDPRILQFALKWNF